MPEGKIIGVAQCVDGARIHCFCFEDIILPILWLLQYFKKKIYLFGCDGSWLQPMGPLLYHRGSFVVALSLLSNCGTQAQLLHSRWDLPFLARV